MAYARNSYARDERQKILNYILDHNLYFNVRGRIMWQNMENDNVCPGRTWQSMKQQFHSVIINTLDTLNIDDTEKQRLLNCFHKRHLFGKRERERSVYNDDEHGRVSKKSRNELFKDENETIATEEKRITENQNETNKDKMEKVQNTNEEKNSNTKKIGKLIIPTVCKNVVRQEIHVTEKEQNQKQIMEKETDNSEEINNLSEGTKSSSRIHENRENNSTENEGNENQITVPINEEKEEEPVSSVEEFSEEDDIKIIRYINENMDWTTLQFYDALYENCKNALINHSALSIKNRFLNVILPKLYKYEILNINDITLFYDRAGVDIPEEFIQIMLNSENSENNSEKSEVSNKTDSVIIISDSSSSSDNEFSEEKEEDIINKNNNPVVKIEEPSDKTVIHNNNKLSSENKENFHAINILTLTKNPEGLFTNIQNSDKINLSPSKPVFLGEFLAGQLCLSLNNEKHVFILDSIVGDNYDVLINELTKKYSILNTNIHKVSEEKLEVLTQVKTLNEKLDQKLLELLRQPFKHRRIKFVPQTAIMKTLGVPNASQLIKTLKKKMKCKFNNILHLPSTKKYGTKLESNCGCFRKRNKLRKNLEVEENLNICSNNSDKSAINEINISEHSSPIISMSLRRQIVNKNKKMCESTSQEINLGLPINEICNEIGGKKELSPRTFNMGKDESSLEGNNIHLNCNEYIDEIKSQNPIQIYILENTNAQNDIELKHIDNKKHIPQNNEEINPENETTNPCLVESQERVSIIKEESNIFELSTPPLLSPVSINDKNDTSENEENNLANERKNTDLCEPQAITFPINEGYCTSPGIFCDMEVQQEIMLCNNECNSEYEPLFEIEGQQSEEEIYASPMSEFKEDNNSQLEDTEMINQCNKTQINLQNVMQQNVLLSKRCKQIVGKKTTVLSP